VARRTLPLIPIFVVILLGVVAWRLSPLWPGPPLPPNATPLHIETQAPHLVPNSGCPTALLGPLRLAISGNDLIFLSAESGEPVEVVWPSGWVAWRIEGRALLVDRDGSVVGRQGEVIPAQFGGGIGADDAFKVCASAGR
jgi:hypothetical protein